MTMILFTSTDGVLECFHTAWRWKTVVDLRKAIGSLPFVTGNGSWSIEMGVKGDDYRILRRSTSTLASKNWPHTCFKWLTSYLLQMTDLKLASNDWPHTRFKWLTSHLLQMTDLTFALNDWPHTGFKWLTSHLLQMASLTLWSNWSFDLWKRELCGVLNYDSLTAGCCSLFRE